MIVNQGFIVGVVDMARPQMGTIHFFGERLGIRGYQAHPITPKTFREASSLSEHSIGQWLRVSGGSLSCTQNAKEAT